MAKSWKRQRHNLWASTNKQNNDKPWYPSWSEELPLKLTYALAIPFLEFAYIHTKLYFKKIYAPESE